MSWCSVLPGKETPMPEIILRPRWCRACAAIFCICRHCDRGQCYCSPACRQGARRQQKRAADLRYQRTDAGRRAHRIRQRNYRLRQAKARVTDHGPHSIMRPRTADDGEFRHCAVCGRYSRWIDPFPAIPLRQSVHRQRRAAGNCSRNYVFR